MQFYVKLSANETLNTLKEENEDEKQRSITSINDWKKIRNFFLGGWWERCLYFITSRSLEI